MDYDNTNKGAISKNTRKTEASHADITGSIDIEGKQYWLKGWSKERKDGSGSFYSLSASPKEAIKAPAPEGEIPF